LAPEVAGKVDIDVTVRGGGFMGQAEAARTAIGRGLVDFTGDMEVKDKLASYDRTLVISDHRRKETKKYGGPGARAKKQKSYR
jgi:small subunit ribosomal protein S9